MVGERQAHQASALLLLVEVEAAARLLEFVGDRARFGLLLRKHEQIVRDVMQRNAGHALRSTELSLLARFDDAARAAQSALEIQSAAAREPWPFGAKLRARIALHAAGLARGTQDPAELDLDRVTGIAAAAFGGQVLVSQAARTLLRSASLPAGAALHALGAHRLADLHYPERLFELEVPGLEVDRPARALRARLHNLAPAASSFIGRATHLDAAGLLLRRGQVRLLTLIGPAGYGKTRLALVLAAQLREAYPDGVFHVPLAGLCEPQLIGPALAQALAIYEGSGASVIESVIQQLWGKRALLVLDHVRPDARVAPVLAHLLASCPQLTLLATSRVALGLPFEQVYEVPPLALPGVLAANDSSLPECEAALLFVERARAFRQGFELNRTNAQAIAETCTKLAGVPLALELAAASLRALTPEAVASRIASLLERAVAQPKPPAELPNRSAPGEQSLDPRLRAALELSYELLDAETQGVFQRLGLFGGGIASDAADERLDWLGPRRDRLLACIQALYESGLLVRENGRPGARLRMTDAVRGFALAQLAGRAELERAALGHARAFAAFAERHAQQVLRAGQRPAVEALIGELDNLRAALRYALGQGELALVASLIQVLLWLFIARGLFTEGRAWLEQALLIAERSGASTEAARILTAASWLALAGGDHLGAARCAERALGLFGGQGVPLERARCQTALGTASLALGRTAEGRRYLVHALALQRDLRDAGGAAWSLLSLGDDARASGDDELAETRYGEALSLMRAEQDVYLPGFVLHHLAQLRLRAGDDPAARKWLAEALELGREYHYPGVIHLYLAAMAELAGLGGRPRDGARLFGAVSASLTRSGVSFERVDQQQLERGMAAARESLGDEPFEQAFAEGSHLSLEDALAAAERV